jgi:hypothetical protein
MVKLYYGYTMFWHHKGKNISKKIKIPRMVNIAGIKGQK